MRTQGSLVVCAIKRNSPTKTGEMASGLSPFRPAEIALTLIVGMECLRWEILLGKLLCNRDSESTRLHGLPSGHRYWTDSGTEAKTLQSSRTCGERRSC